jgi:hypothetical protein
MPLIKVVGLNDRKPRLPRKSLRGFGIGATWVDLVTAEPKLQDFMDEVRSVLGSTYESCSDGAWYGWNIRNPRRGIKARLRKFMGGESPVFFAAYRALYGSLPLCRHCLERDPREADLEWVLVRRLEGLGIRPIQRQVKCRAGIADVVTPDTVYEVKLSLTRVSLFQAVGQVSVYARELERPKRVIVGQWTPDTDRLAASIRKLGIDVEAW